MISIASKNDYDQEKAINDNFRFNFSSKEEKIDKISSFLQINPKIAMTILNKNNDNLSKLIQYIELNKKKIKKLLEIKKKLIFCFNHHLTSNIITILCSIGYTLKNIGKTYVSKIDKAIRYYQNKLKL